MSEKIDMSLDEIIKKNKIGRKSGGGQRRSGGVKVGGGKKRPIGGAPGVKRQGGGPRRGGPAGNKKRRSGGGGDFSSRGQAPRRGGIAAPSGPAKLVINNLHHEVTDSDIKELFSEFGKLRSSAVHYDKSGRSLGTADVVFDRRSDAIKAMKKYNDVPLDGREMKIELTTSNLGPVSTDRVKGSQLVPRKPGGGGKVEKKVVRDPRRRKSGGQRPDGGRQGGQAGDKKGHRRRKSGGGAGSKTAKQPPPTREELDKELESYNQSR